MIFLPRNLLSRFMKDTILVLILWFILVGFNRRQCEESDHPREDTEVAAVVESVRSSGPTLYVVTPTYRRMMQRPDIIKIANALRNLDFIFWIVVETGPQTYSDIKKILEDSGVKFRYMSAETLTDEKYKKVGRGVFQRRAAVNWLREEKKEGVVYFADDDNTYDYKIFEQIRQTRRISAFPVGFVADHAISSPIVKAGKIVGFHDSYKAGRIFVMDMAGFAVHTSLLKSEEANFPLDKRGIEDDLIRKLGVKVEDLEPLMNKCTEVLVWHTRDYIPRKPSRENLPVDYTDTNLKELYDNFML